MAYRILVKYGIWCRITLNNNSAPNQSLKLTW